MLLEHYAGAFPAWLAPVQVRVLPVRDDHQAYALRVADRLRAEGFRADLVEADEPLGARIRKAKLEKLPYVLVVGDDDVAAGTVGVNRRGADEPERGVDGRRRSSTGCAAEVAGASRDGALMPLDHLWAGWRSAYVSRVVDSRTLADARRGRGRSLFERILAGGRRRGDEAAGIVHRGPTLLRAPQRASPTRSGHLMVLPNRAVADLEDLTPDEHDELWATVRDAVRGAEGGLPAATA